MNVLYVGGYGSMMNTLIYGYNYTNIGYNPLEFKSYGDLFLFKHAKVHSSVFLARRKGEVANTLLSTAVDLSVFPDLGGIYTIIHAKRTTNILQSEVQARPTPKTTGPDAFGLNLSTPSLLCKAEPLTLYNRQGS